MSSQTPRLILRLEGAVVLILSTWLYHLYGESWVLYGLLFLAPDLGMLGYLRSPALGARTYNLLHTYVLPLGLVGGATVLDGPFVGAVGLIWMAHIGFDRMLGYGLKYDSGFHDTHLGTIGSGSSGD